LGKQTNLFLKYKKQKPPQVLRKLVVKDKPGTELFSRGATPRLSSPQQRFTTEFGKESEWFHRAIGTRKALRELKIKNVKLEIALPNFNFSPLIVQNPEDCIDN
jgi:hypothetical protein